MNDERRLSKLASFFAFCLFPFALATGCQQKMADQPAHRPYEQSKMFAHGQSARPLANGVIHRGQLLSDDPMLTWLTPKGKAPEHNEAYKFWVQSKTKPTTDPVTNQPIPPISASEAEGMLAQKPQAGSPNDIANFVDTVPFEMNEAHLKRGQLLYNAACAECHGAAGHGNGKIPERGFLRPPSYHVDPDGLKKDWSKMIVQPTSTVAYDFTGNPQGTSRGFYKYGLTVPLKEVPIGYIYQVITWGYGGMASHETQIPKAEDRWKVASYVRTLQLSQAFDATKLTAAQREALDHPGKKSDAKPEEHK